MWQTRQSKAFFFFDKDWMEVPCICTFFSNVSHCISGNYNVVLLIISIVCVKDVEQRTQKHETSTTGTGTDFFPSHRIK